MVLEGVRTWTIESANVVYRKGYLGDLVIELADGTSRQLQGYGLYAQNLKYSSMSGLQMDTKILLGSVYAVLKSKGVVEGGTGQMAKEFEKAKML